MRLFNIPPTPEEVVAGSGRAHLDIKALLQLIGVVLTLAISVASNQVPRWFFLVPVGYFVLLVAVYIWPAAWKKGKSHRQARRRLKLLLARWGDFGDQVAMFHNFFKHDHVDSLPHLLLGLSIWIGEKKVSGICHAELNLINAFLAFAAGRMGDLAFRARQQPINVAQAQNLVSDFEVLVDSPNRLGIFRMLWCAKGDAAWDKQHVEFLEGFKHHLRNYEAFARQANREIGEEFFREHLRVL